MRPADISSSTKNTTSPFQFVVELFSGVLGVPPGGWPKKLQKIILRGRLLSAAVQCKPGSSEMEEEQKSLEKNLGHAVRRDDLLRFRFAFIGLRQNTKNRQRSVSAARRLYG